MHLWCRIIEQVMETLKLLWTFRLNPKISAEIQLNGVFGFNVTPMVLPGTKVIIHGKINGLKIWSPHGFKGWYVGPAQENYRCYRLYLVSSSSIIFDIFYSQVILCTRILLCMLTQWICFFHHLNQCDISIGY